jgi:hypothetical protein
MRPDEEGAAPGGKSEGALRNEEKVRSRRCPGAPGISACPEEGLPRSEMRFESPRVTVDGAAAGAADMAGNNPEKELKESSCEPGAAGEED